MRNCKYNTLWAINIKISKSKLKLTNTNLFPEEKSAFDVYHNCNKYSENAKSCKALVIMYINKLILFTFS